MDLLWLKFRAFIKTTPSNYSLFIYDGDLLSEVEIEDIVHREAEEINSSSIKNSPRCQLESP